jgi:hypothetical protein
MRLDIDLLTAQLASLVSGGTVDLVSAAASREAAIARGQAVAKSVWVYRLGWDDSLDGIGMRLHTEQFGVLTLYRSLAENPDAGDGEADAIDTISNAVAGRLVPAAGWKPAAGWFALESESGALVSDSKQLVAWEDLYTARRYLDATA